MAEPNLEGQYRTYVKEFLEGVGRKYSYGQDIEACQRAVRIAEEKGLRIRGENEGLFLKVFHLEFEDKFRKSRKKATSIPTI